MRRGQRNGSVRGKRRMMRLRTSRRTKARISDAAASNSVGEPLYRSQLSTRWAARTLPPDTDVICDTCRRIPASRRKRTSPRWYRLARKPPPERARPSLLVVVVICGTPGSGKGAGGTPGSDLLMAGLLDLRFENGLPAAAQHRLRLQSSKQVKDAGDDAGPAGLMARP